MLPSLADRVRVLKKVNGTLSNVAIVLTGQYAGKIVVRQDGEPPNCDMKELSFILSGSENTYKDFSEAINGSVTEVQ